MRAFKTMYQTEPLTLWLKLIRWFAVLLYGKPYLYQMKVRFTNGGQVVEIDNPKALVNYMRTDSAQYDDNSKYMKDYARRAVINADEDIRATSEKEFVEDLIKHRHIIVLKE